MKKNAFVLFVFILLAVVYFYDVFAKNLILASDDGLLYFYPIMSVVLEQYKNGVLPLWNSYMFSGFPLMASSQNGVFYPLYIIPMLLFPPHLAYNIDIVLHIALAGFFTFLYSKKIGIKAFPSFTAGLIFAFLGYLMSHIEHLSVLHTAVWLPLILYFFEDLRLKATLRGALLASLPVAMQIFAGHPQIYFYTYIIIFLFVLFHSFYMPGVIRVRFICLSIAALALGLVMGSPQFYATYELSSFGVRPGLNYGVFSEYSFPVEGIPGLLFPLLYGKEGYVGVLTILLALVTVLRGRKSDIHVRFWGLIAVVTLVLALGDSIRPLHKIMFHVPVYKSFRGVSKHLFEFGFALSVLSALGMSFIESKKGEKYLVSLLLIMFTAVAISFISFLLFGKLTLYGAYMPLAAMSFCLVCLFVLKKTRRYRLFRYLFVAVVLLEILSLRSTEWSTELPPASEINNYGSNVFGFIGDGRDRTAFFTKGVIIPLAMRYGVNMISGYDPLVLKDYCKLISLGGVGGLSSKWRELTANNVILSMLNTRYLFIPSEETFVETLKGVGWDGAGLKPVTKGLLETGGYKPLYKKIFNAYGLSIYENINYMPRAFSVAELLALGSVEEIKAEFYLLRANPRLRAFVSSKDLEEIGTGRFSQGKVKILKYRHNKAVLKTVFKDRGFVILADQYYPGWKAFVDGKPAKIYKTNGVMRGVVVPEGIYELTFEYSPTKIYVLMAVSIFMLTGMIILILLLQRREKRGH